MLADDRGRLVPFRNAEAIADQVNDLLDNEDERNAMRKRARRAATRGLLLRVSLGVNTYRTDYGDYPPDRNPNWTSGGGWSSWCFKETYQVWDINMPSETLWFFLDGMFEATKNAAHSPTSRETHSLPAQ